MLVRYCFKGISDHGYPFLQILHVCFLFHIQADILYCGFLISFMNRYSRDRKVFLLNRKIHLVRIEQKEYAVSFSEEPGFLL